MGEINLKLKKYMDSKNISRNQLSKLIDIRYHTVHDYYKNKVKRYDGYILAKICDALNCELWDILDYRK